MVLKDVAKEKLGYVNMKNKQVTDHTVEELSSQQKKLRLEMNNNTNPEKHNKLKQQRKRLLKEIQQRIKTIKEKEIDEILEEVDKTKDDARMFKAVRKLNLKRYENPFVTNEQGKSITNPQEIYKIVENHFKEHFYKENIPEIKCHLDEPKPLNNKIMSTEIKDVVSKMSNNKAALNNIPMELIKYSPMIVH